MSESAVKNSPHGRAGSKRFKNYFLNKRENKLPVVLIFDLSGGGVFLFSACLSAAVGVAATLALGVFAAGFTAAAPPFCLPPAVGFAVLAEVPTRFGSTALDAARALAVPFCFALLSVFCATRAVEAVAPAFCAEAAEGLDGVLCGVAERCVLSAVFAVAFLMFSADKRLALVVCVTDERDDVMVLNAGRVGVRLSAGAGVNAAVRDMAVFCGAAGGADAIEPTDFLGLDGL